MIGDPGEPGRPGDKVVYNKLYSLHCFVDLFHVEVIASSYKVAHV